MPTFHTLSDVARRAGVALNTARKVIRKDPTVRPYIRERVRQAIRELDYHPNLLARGLRSRSMPIVPITVADLHLRFFGQLARDLCVHLVRHGFEPALYLNTQHLIKLTRRLSPCAAVLTGGYDEEDLRRLSRTQKVVVIGRHLHPLPHVADVRMDFAPAYRHLTRALAAEGRHRVALCSAAHTEAVRHGWISFGKFDVLARELRKGALMPVVPDDAEVFASPRHVATFLEAHPGAFDAVVCEDDHEASFLFGELVSRGLRVPEDVRIVGCDANHMLRGTWSIAVDTAALAREAVALIQELLKGNGAVPPRTYVPQLVTAPLDVQAPSPGEESLATP